MAINNIMHFLQLTFTILSVRLSLRIIRRWRDAFITTGGTACVCTTSIINSTTFSTSIDFELSGCGRKKIIKLEIGKFSNLFLLCGTDQAHGFNVHALGSGILLVLSITHLATDFITANT